MGEYNGAQPSTAVSPRVCCAQLPTHYNKLQPQLAGDNLKGSCCCVTARSATYGLAYAVDGVTRGASRANYARALDTSQFLDPYDTMNIVLNAPTPWISAVKVWQSDIVNTGGVTTNISVWLHEYAQLSSPGLPLGNQLSFLSGVRCTSGMWPTTGIASQPEFRVGMCNQTIGSPGAKYVTLQKFNNWVTYTTNYFYVSEVQVLYDGESPALAPAA